MVIRFGKHAGKKITELPIDYISWAKDNISNEEVRKACQQEFKIRQPKRELTEKEKKRLIFGKDKRKEVVNVSITEDSAYLYYKDGSSESFAYNKWCLSSKQEGEKLKGHKYYDHLKFLDHDSYVELENSWDKNKWTPRSPEEGFMLLNGVTYFKGMKVEDVSLLSIDIEAQGFDPEAEDAIIGLVSCTFRKDGAYSRKMFDIVEYDFDEQRMTKELSEYVREVNPDIIIGHNILSYDLPYLNRGTLEFGRDGSEVKFAEKPSKKRKDGSQSYEYYNANIHGREIVDTLFLSITYDVGRNFPSYGLKAIEKYLEIAEDDRIEWNFNKFKVKDMIDGVKSRDQEMIDKWQEFKKYCSQDSDSPILLFDIMAPSFFYLNQCVPKTLQQMVNEATGSQIDSVMIRSYLQDRNSIPKTTQREKFEGAISMGIPGIYDNVRKVDVASLYPSIMLQYDIYDKVKDPEKHMPTILNYFRDERLKNKKLAKETKDKYYDDLQGSQKIFINSLYGFMGAGYLLYNYPHGASEVTRHGREILQTGVKWATGHELEKVVKNVVNEGTAEETIKYEWILGKKLQEGKGYTLVNVDTDSFSYTDGTKPSDSHFQNEIDELNSLYPKMIVWEDDGIFDKLIVVKAKNYIMKVGDKVKYKGSSILDQKKEPALVEYLYESIGEIIDKNRIEALQQIYNRYCLRALKIDKEDIENWTVKKTYTDKMKKSTRANETKVIDAINYAIENNAIKNIQEGDKLWVYQAIDGEIQKIVKGEPKLDRKGNPKMIENKILKFPELFNDDVDKWHYVARVHSTLNILKNIVDIEQFIKYANKSNRNKLEML